MTIEYRCDSCGKSKPTRFGGTGVDLPSKWMKVVLRWPSVDTEVEYALCDECSKMTMQFGELHFEPREDEEDG